MNEKRSFYTEFSYLLGIVILALGTAMMERADYGMSMVVAPAYLLHLKLSPIFPFFSFGMAEYCLQGILLAALAVITRKRNATYLFSFATAVFYGFVLDAAIALIEWIPAGPRFAFFLGGMLLGSLGVSLLFHTYIAPEAYELFVKELAALTGKDIHRVKTIYDCCSCLLSVLLSFLFFGFGHFEGVKLGTIVCALVNGACIGLCSKFLESRFHFQDAWPLRTYFS